MGTSEMKEILVAAARIADFIEALSDGPDLGDIPEGFRAIKSIPNALKDAKLALEEYRAMTDAQAAELEAFVVSEFNLVNDTVEMYIEEGFKFIISFHGFLKARG